MRRASSAASRLTCDAILPELEAHFLTSDLSEEPFVREMADAEFRLRRGRDLMHTVLARQMTKLQALHPRLSALELEVQAIETMAETDCSWSTWLRSETKYERQYERAYEGWTRYQAGPRPPKSASTVQDPPAHATPPNQKAA